MKFFQLNTHGLYWFSVTTAIDLSAAPWMARLGAIAQLDHCVAEGVYMPYRDTCDQEDLLIVEAANTFMSLVHVFGHSGNRFVFTGLLDAQWGSGVRFYDVERMIEVHVWPEFISIYHFDSNMHYRIQLLPNFR